MTLQGELCGVCESGPLNTCEEQDSVEYKGIKGEIRFLSSVCESCGIEQFTEDQLRQNKRAFIEFRKQVLGLCSGERVRAIRKKLEMSQEQAAKIFGGGKVAFSKYESGDVVQAESMDNLLRVAEAFPEVVKFLIARTDVQGASIRGSNWKNMSKTGAVAALNPYHRKAVNDEKVVSIEKAREYRRAS